MKYNKKSILIIAVILILICIVSIFAFSGAINTENITGDNVKTNSKMKKTKMGSTEEKKSNKDNKDKEQNKDKNNIHSSKEQDIKSTLGTYSQSSESGSDKTSGGSNSSNKGSVTKQASNSYSNNSAQSKKTKVWIVDSPAKDAVYESVPEWGERPYWDVRVEANTSYNKRFYNRAEFSAYEDWLDEVLTDEENNTEHYYVGTEKYITGYKQVVVTPAQPEQGHWEWK